jgi:hypothetical protein
VVNRTELPAEATYLADVRAGFSSIMLPVGGWGSQIATRSVAHRRPTAIMLRLGGWGSQIAT